MRLASWQVWSGAVILLGLCTAAHAGKPVETGLVVSLQMDALAPGAVAARTITQRTILRDGERIGMTLWVDRPAHVYVVHYSADGWSRLLFPAVAEQPLPAGERARVPGGGRRLTVADGPDEEVLYVIATPVPIQRIVPDACRWLRLYCPDGKDPLALRGDKPKPPPPPPPKGTKAAERGQASEGPEHVIAVRADKEGVAVMRLVLRHEP